MSNKPSFTIRSSKMPYGLASNKHLESRPNVLHYSMPNLTKKWWCIRKKDTTMLLGQSQLCPILKLLWTLGQKQEALKSNKVNQRDSSRSLWRTCPRLLRINKASITITIRCCNRKIIVINWHRQLSRWPRGMLLFVKHGLFSTLSTRYPSNLRSITRLWRSHQPCREVPRATLVRGMLSKTNLKMPSEQCNIEIRTIQNGLISAEMWVALLLLALKSKI